MPRRCAVWGHAVALLLAIAVAQAVAQIPVGPGTTVITPPKPIMGLEFVQEVGIERWEVRLTGRQPSSETAYLRFHGQGCTYADEIYRGLITFLYDDMTFKTKSGRSCTVQAIERDR
jgi:hypothetical protein